MNEHFDVEKARELREQATARYRKAARATAYWAAALCVPLLVLASYAAIRWSHATDFDQKVMYAILYILSFAGCLLIELGLEGRLRNVLLMKEIKQLRLDLLESSNLPLEQAAGGVESLGMWKLAGFSRKGIVTTFLLLVIGTSALVVTLFPTRPEYSLFKTSSTMAEDGSAQFVYTLSCPHGGATPLSELEFTTGSVTNYDQVWDERGRELKCETTEPTPDRHQFKIALAEPVMPGERFGLKVKGTTTKAARLEGDEWNVTDDSTFNSPTKISHYIQLPKGAIVTPGKAYTICQSNQGPIVRVQKESAANEKSVFTVRYRLPHEQEEGASVQEDANQEPK